MTMPSRDYLENVVNCQAISADGLVDTWQHTSQVLILDCRSQAEFSRSHIRGAIHLSLPASIIILRRLANGKFSVPNLVKDNEQRETFTKFWKDSTLILYDSDTDFMTTTSSSALSTLVTRLHDERCTVVCLQGGFSKFKILYPEWCESESLETPVKGLETLRISSVIPDQERCDSGLWEQTSSGNNESGSAPFPVEILPNLFLGNASNSSDLEALEKHGIHYVLNVTPNLPNAFERKGLNIKYMQIPIQDHWSQNMARFFPQAIEFIDEGRQKKLGVLVHCLAGISRSVTITLAYLMHELSIPLNDAYDFVSRRKSNIAPNFNFLGQLKDYERQLNLSPCSCQQSPCLCQTLHFTSPTKTTPDSGVLLETWT